MKRKRQAEYFTKSQMREAEGESYADENVVDIETESAIERNSLISCIRNPSRLSSFNEEMSRKSIADLQVAEEFKAAKFTNMDMNKRKVLVQSIVTALRSPLSANPTLCFMLLEVIRLVTL